MNSKDLPTYDDDDGECWSLCVNRDTEGLKNFLLLNSDHFDVNIYDYTSVLAACGYNDILDILLEHGRYDSYTDEYECDVNFQSLLQDCLHGATRRDMVECVKLLVEKYKIDVGNLRITASYMYSTNVKNYIDTWTIDHIQQIIDNLCDQKNIVHIESVLDIYKRNDLSLNHVIVRSDHREIILTVFEKFPHLTSNEHVNEFYLKIKNL